MNIKKDDKVVVLSGKDKGKEGKVLSADPKGGKLIVEGVNVATKHQKPKNQQDQGGIIKTETPIYACKVMVVCPKCACSCSSPSRPAGRAILPGSAGRFCRRWRNFHAAARKKRAKSRPPDEKSQKKFGFLQKNASKIAADVLE